MSDKICPRCGKEHEMPFHSCSFGNTAKPGEPDMQHEIANLQASIVTLEDNLGRSSALLHERDKTIEDLRLNNDQLREALRQLHDFQNGCPLPSYEKGYGEAMCLTVTALAATENK